MKVVEDFESRPHKAVSFVVERDKGGAGMEGGRLPGEAQKKEAEEDCRERQVRKEIVQEAVAGIQKKASALVDAKPTAQRRGGQSVKQTWDCSQIENEEDEDDEDWQKRGPDGNAMG